MPSASTTITTVIVTRIISGSAAPASSATPCQLHSGRTWFSVAVIDLLYKFHHVPILNTAVAIQEVRDMAEEVLISIIGLDEAKTFPFLPTQHRSCPRFAAAASMASGTAAAAAARFAAATLGKLHINCSIFSRTVVISD